MWRKSMETEKQIIWKRKEDPSIAVEVRFERLEWVPEEVKAINPQVGVIPTWNVMVWLPSGTDVKPFHNRAEAITEAEEVMAEISQIRGGGG